MWQGLIIWIELAEFTIVGTVITVVGAWGLYECFRAKRRARVHREADEVVARCWEEVGAQ